MIRRIVGSFLLVFMVIALFMSFVGIRRIGYGTEYMSFLRNLSRTYDNWKITIPDIPTIDKLLIDSDGGGLLEAVKRIFNVIVSFFNGIIYLINIIILILNTLINVLQYFLTFIYSFRDFINSMKPDENGLVGSVALLPKKPFTLFGVGGFPVAI